jgi:hypothetical protein
MYDGAVGNNPSCLVKQLPSHHLESVLVEQSGVEQVCVEWLGEQIRYLIVSGYCQYAHKPMLDMGAKVMVLDIDVLGPWSELMVGALLHCTAVFVEHLAMYCGCG